MYTTNTVSTQQGGDGGMQANQLKKGMDPKMIFCVGATKRGWCSARHQNQPKNVINP